MFQDNLHKLTFVNALDTTIVASNTTTNGVVLDLRDAHACTFVVRTGSYTDGAYAISVDTSNDSTFTVGVTNIVCTPGSTDINAIVSGQTTTLNAANKLSAFGIIPVGRYARVKIVSTSVTNGASFSAIAVLNPSVIGL